MDPYKILWISRDSTEEEIKLAYRKKAKEKHPDLWGTKEAMQEVIFAYKQILKSNNPVYDEKLTKQDEEILNVINININRYKDFIEQKDELIDDMWDVSDLEYALNLSKNVLYWIKKAKSMGDEFWSDLIKILESKKDNFIIVTKIIEWLCFLEDGDYFVFNALKILQNHKKYHSDLVNELIRYKNAEEYI